MKASVRPSRLGVAVLAVLVFVSLVPAAQATFPGANGRIAFSSERDGNREIYTRSPSNGTQSRLTTLASDDRTPVWNADGTLIAFASNRGAEPSADYEIYRMAANGAGVVALTDNAFNDNSPAWAPSGTQLVVVQSPPGTTHNLAILEADGSGAATVLTGSSPTSLEVEPDWSPDGERIAFAAYPNDGATQRDIFTIEPDGSNLTNLTNSPGVDDREPSWSPDNAQIAYASFANSNYDIHTMDADGTDDVNRTLFPAAHDREPVWSPDKTQIAFVSRRNFDGDEIYVMPAAGGSASTFTFSPGPDSEPDWQQPDPPPPTPACNDGLDNDGDTKIDYPTDPGCSSETDNNEADGTDGLVRPKGASPLKVPLVTAYQACVSPNRTHGPPLAFPSCNPPVESSTAITMGEPTVNGAAANFEGSLKLKVKVGTPGVPDDSDVLFVGSMTDVRCKAGTTTCGNANTADGADYTGGLQGSMIVRLTDRFNAVAPGGGVEGATVVDIPFPFPWTCANSATAAQGGQCGINTSFNAMVPQMVRDGKRAVVEIGQVIVRDGGSDGDTNTAPNTDFVRQGVFVP